MKSQYKLLTGERERWAITPYHHAYVGKLMGERCYFTGYNWSMTISIHTTSYEPGRQPPYSDNSGQQH